MATGEGIFNEDLNKVSDDVKRINNMMVAVVIVVVGIVLSLVFTLGAMITSSLADKQATAQETRDKITNQTQIITTLSDKIDHLSAEIKDLNEQKAIQTTR